MSISRLRLRSFLITALFALLPFAMVYGGTPPPPAANPAIAFYDGGTLKVMNADGTNITAIYTPPSSLSNPSWSPNGGAITFSLSGSGVWRINIAISNGNPVGTGLTQLTTSGTYPAWAPVGNVIAFYRNLNLSGDPQLLDGTLWTVPDTGGAPTLIHTEVDRTIHALAFSPTADRIVFASNPNGLGDTNIKVLDIAGGTTTEIVSEAFTAPSSNDFAHVDWARTQDLIAFSIGSVNGGDLSVYTIPASGGTPMFVVAGHAPTWSPNDAEILIVRLLPTTG